MHRGQAHRMALLRRSSRFIRGCWSNVRVEIYAIRKSAPALSGQPAINGERADPISVIL